MPWWRETCALWAQRTIFASGLRSRIQATLSAMLSSRAIPDREPAACICAAWFTTRAFWMAHSTSSRSKRFA